METFNCYVYRIKATLDDTLDSLSFVSSLLRTLWTVWCFFWTRKEKSLDEQENWLLTVFELDGVKISISMSEITIRDLIPVLFSVTYCRYETEYWNCVIPKSGVPKNFGYSYFVTVCKYRKNRNFGIGTHDTTCHQHWLSIRFALPFVPSVCLFVRLSVC